MATTSPSLEQRLERLYGRTVHGIKLGLEAEQALLRRLGDPQEKMACIHVAGTNGKGSVCAIIESILREEGFRTGLYTSPHLVRFNERFRIRGESIRDDALCDLIDVIDPEAHEAGRELGGREITFFEFATAMAFQHFANHDVQIAVLETGMGGRLDATNVVTPLLSVITPVAMDHAQYLGDSIEKIAAEKCGIIKPGRPVVCGLQQEKARDVISKKASELGAPLIMADDLVSCRRIDGDLCGQRIKVSLAGDDLSPVRLPLLGAHQVENAMLALAVVQYLREANVLRIRDTSLKSGLEKTAWSGRMELICDRPPTFVDAAHNPAGAATLARTLKEIRGDRPVGLVAGFAGDKDVEGFLRQVKPQVNALWAAQFDGPRCLAPDAFSAHAERSGLSLVGMGRSKDMLDAAQSWAVEQGGMVCVAGSIFLAGEILAARTP